MRCTGGWPRSGWACVLAMATVLGCADSDPAGESAGEPPASAGGTPAGAQLARRADTGDERARPAYEAAGAPLYAERLLGCGYWGGPVRTWISDAHEQTYFLQEFGNLDVWDSQLPFEGAESKLAFRYRGGFDVRFVHGATRDVYGAAGFDEEGDLVLELWRLVPSGPEPRPPSAGAPAVQTELFDKAFEVTRVHDAPVAAELLGLAVDREVRYALLLTRDDASGDVVLHQHDLTPGSALVPILTSREQPALASMRILTIQEHVERGRVADLFDDLPYTRRLWLVDADDDGRFDAAPLIGDPTFFNFEGRDEQALWRDLRCP